MLVPYLHYGLAAGHRCVCILEAVEQPALVEGIGSAGDVDVDDCLHRGQLELITAADSYPRRGTVSVDDMLAFWKASLHTAVQLDGYDASFATGDLGALGD